MSWIPIRTAIKTKLDTLVGPGLLIGMVDDKFHNKISSYPAVMFEPSSDPGEFFTNSENMHVYTYEFVVVQEFESNGMGRDEAIRILGNAVDAVVNAFDNYQQLGGACDYTEAVTGEWFTANAGNGMALVARMTLRCHKLKAVT